MLCMSHRLVMIMKQNLHDQDNKRRVSFYKYNKMQIISLVHWIALEIILKKCK